MVGIAFSFHILVHSFAYINLGISQETSSESVPSSEVSLKWFSLIDRVISSVRKMRSQSYKSNSYRRSLIRLKCTLIAA
ncbi:MAG: hypothetical protein AAFY50_24125, partial [Cyanobacteria bacterium J06648_1]